MASVFLSYAHDDHRRAARIAEALEAAGHDAWWDREIHAGRRFAEEIDKALTTADWIVVLWSKASISSPWVHDEAAVGRDTGRLIPVLLDPVVPPLGFRQYQSITLGNVMGRSIDTALRPLLAALGEAPGQARDATHGPRPAAARTIWPARRLAWLAGLALLIIAAAGLWWWRSTQSANNNVAVIAAPGADQAMSSDLARQVVIDLGRFPGGLLNSLSFPSDVSSAANAAFRSTIAAQRDGKLAHVDISLAVKHRPGIAWATSIDGFADRLVDLRQQTAAELSAALMCAVHYGPTADRLTDEVFRLFLTGCVGITKMTEASASSISTFKSVTGKAPDFGPGWANLALLQVWQIPTASEADRPALIKDMRANLAMATKLAPELEETLAADALIHRPDESPWAHALPMLDKAVTRYPDSALLLALRSDKLMSVGRMTESVENTKRALEAEPLTPKIRSAYIFALAYAGLRSAAVDQLAKAEAIWPNAETMRQARYRIDLRYGDPRNALKMLDSNQSGDNGGPAYDVSWRSFLEARIDPSPANIDRALESFRDRYRRDPADIPGYAQALGTFGRVDEFYAVTRNPLTVDSMTVSTDTLFRSQMTPILRDPRFIELAQRLGLLAFWRSSGAWPDFCRDPQLPYDCRAEAANYR